MTTYDVAVMPFATVKANGEVGQNDSPFATLMPLIVYEAVQKKHVMEFEEFSLELTKTHPELMHKINEVKQELAEVLQEWGRSREKRKRE